RGDVRVEPGGAHRAQGLGDRVRVRGQVHRHAHGRHAVGEQLDVAGRVVGAVDRVGAVAGGRGREPYVVDFESFDPRPRRSLRAVDLRRHLAVQSIDLAGLVVGEVDGDLGGFLLGHPVLGDEAGEDGGAEADE
ncbi:hypothetical protein ADL26_13820, partial [Thermoactinomyces vulgaris]